MMNCGYTIILDDMRLLKQENIPYEKMRNKYVYLQEKYLHQMCDGTYECNTHNDI